MHNQIYKQLTHKLTKQTTQQKRGEGGKGVYLGVRLIKQNQKKETPKSHQTQRNIYIKTKKKKIKKSKCKNNKQLRTKKNNDKTTSQPTKTKI